MRLAWKIVKIFLYFIFGLILLLFIAGLFVDPIAKRLLEKEAGKAGKGQYSLHLGDVQVSMLRGNIRFRDIRFKTDTAGADFGPVVEAEAKEFSASGLSWLTFVMERNLFIDQLYLEGLVLKVKARPSTNGTRQAPFRIDQLDIYPHIKEHIQTLHLQDLGLKDIDFTLINAGTKDTLHLAAGRLDVRSEDILIDADMLMTKERSFYTALMDLDGDKLQFSSSGQQNWQGELGQLKVNTQEELLAISLRSFSFLQQEAGKADTLMSIELPAFYLQDLNLRKLQQEEIAHIRKLSMEGLDFFHVVGTPLEELPPKEANAREEEGVEHGEAGPLQKDLALSGFTLGKNLPDFVNKLELEELEIGVQGYRQGEKVKIAGLQFSAREIVLDQESAFSHQRFLHAKYVKSSIGKLALIADDAGYQFQWDSLYLHADQGLGDLWLREVLIESEAKNPSTTQMQAQIDGIYMNSFDTRQMVDGGLKLRRVLLQDPRLKMQLPAKKEGGAGKNTFFPLNLYPALEGILYSLSIEALEIAEAGLAISGVEGAGGGHLDVPVFHLALQDVLLDSSSAYAEGRVLHSRDIRFRLSDLHYYFSDNVYDLQLGFFNLSTADQVLGAQNFSYTLRQNVNSEEKAINSLGAINAGTFLLTGLNYAKLLQGQGLSIGSLFLDKTVVELQPTSIAKGQVPQVDASEPADTASLTLSTLRVVDMLPDYLNDNVSIAALDIAGFSIRKAQSLALENLYLKASDIQIDQRTAFADKRFLHAQRLLTGFDTLWIAEGNPEHYVRARAFSFETEEGLGKLRLGQVLVTPQERPLDKPWVEAKLPGLHIPRIHTTALSEGHLSIDHIAINEPEFLAYLPSSEEKNGEKQAAEEKNASPPDVFPLIKNELNSLQLGSVAIQKASLRLAGLGGSYYGLTIPELNIQLEDIHIAEGNAFEKGRVLHTRNIHMDLERMTYLFPDNVYFLQLQSASLRTADKTFNTSGLQYMYGETYEKILEGPKRNDVYRLISDKIQAEGVNFQKLFSNEGLWADSIQVKGLNFFTHKDLNKPEEARIKPMPSDMVLDMGLPLSIRALNVEEAKIAYEEMAEGADAAGLVTIEELSVDITNITNIRTEILKNSTMQVRGRGRLMGEGSFETQIEVPLLGEKNHRITGKLDTLDMSHLNRISRYNSRIAIENGTLYKANWDFEADNDHSFGEFEVSYEDLKVQLSSKDSPDTTGLLKDAGSLMMNLILVETNIAEGENIAPQKAQFEEERNKEKSFFNFYVHSLLNGLMEVIGVPFQ